MTEMTPRRHPLFARVPASLGVLGGVLLVAQGCYWSSALLDTPLNGDAVPGANGGPPARTVEVAYRVTGGAGRARVLAVTPPGETAAVRPLPYTWTGSVDLGEHVQVSASGGTDTRRLTCTISMDGIVVDRITGTDVVCDGYAGREKAAPPPDPKQVAVS
ncbi:hypothetical protein GCM10010182_61340 [Actinomadura cremea]|nr:hypothetical protein GCM10010182_61340 [Actinomadura cremea]